MAAWIELRETLEKLRRSKMEREGVEINDDTVNNQNNDDDSIQQKVFNPYP